MTEAHSTLSQSATHSSRRDRLYRNFLLDTARNHLDAISENFVHEITLSDILALSKQRHGDADTVESEWIGILQEDDILRFGSSSPRSELGPIAQQHFGEELDKVILSMTEFFHADVDWESLGEGERNRLAWTLPEDIRNFMNSISSTRSEVNTAYGRIEDLMNQLGEAHSQVQAGLHKVIATYTPDIHSRRRASNELLAARIEASLIKLSLIRARATQALYDHRSPKNPEATLAQALSEAYMKLTTDAQKRNEEEAALDHQLADYETMLKLVDGDGGGFVQVIEDWTRIQKEREECIRDLRRLGWTGD